MEPNHDILAFIEALITHSIDPKNFSQFKNHNSDYYSFRITFKNGLKFWIDSDDLNKVKLIKKLIQFNLRVQYQEESQFRCLLHLQKGQKYTLITQSELGIGAAVIQFTMEDILLGPWAQYWDAVGIICKKKSARSFIKLMFYGNKSFAIFHGWVSVKNDLWEESENSPIKRSKYSSFDERYLTDAIASVGKPPLYSIIF
ncbi:MAG TPA: hypothetical protein VF412_05180 [Bdellovibrio sp.]|uniref:hypothetical protein n=1 Tax=Bdellovibrio sp. TaxID=28201 RepID=UPI002EE18816